MHVKPWKANGSVEWIQAEVPIVICYLNIKIVMNYGAKKGEELRIRLRMVWHQLLKVIAGAAQHFS